MTTVGFTGHTDTPRSWISVPSSPAQAHPSYMSCFSCSDQVGRHVLGTCQTNSFRGWQPEAQWSDPKTLLYRQPLQTGAPLPTPSCLATEPASPTARRWICPDLHLIASARRRPNLNIRQKIHWKWLKGSLLDTIKHFKGLLTVPPLLRMSLPCFQAWLRQVVRWFQGCSSCSSSQEIFSFHFLLDLALWPLFLTMGSLMLLELPVPSSTSSTMIPPILSSPEPSTWSRFSSNSSFLHSIPPDPNSFQEGEAAVNVSSPPRLLHTGPGDGRGEVGVWLSPFM